MSKLTKLILAVALGMMFCSAVNADPVLYSVPLPTSGLNLGPTESSNFSFNLYQNGFGGMVGGGHFNLSSDQLITALSVWVPGYTPLYSDTSLGTAASSGVAQPAWEYGEPKLFLGDLDVSSTIPQITATVSEQQVQYWDSEHSQWVNYQTSFYPSTPEWVALWKVTFSGLSFAVTGGHDYAFGVSNASDSLEHPFQLTETNCGEKCTTWGFLGFTAQTGSLVNEWAYPGYDVNVELNGPTPEPLTLLMIGTGLGLIGLVRRRRR